MLNSEKDLRISKMLCFWYNSNQRDLPWRHTNDPYLIWISEIILQQTRVDQGLSYYYRFTERFPSVLDLANAQEEEVLKYWQGLGYYSRARNLHAAAVMIKEQFGGVFPTQYKEILALKGVGEYTAAAITSFAWNMPYAVVDGNVFRVLARLFGVSDPIDTGQGKKLFTQLAHALLDEPHAGLHNQAIMEFGALQCVPQSPQCGVCVLQDHCVAFATNSVQSYPIKKQKIKVQNRYLHYFHIVINDMTYLHRRDQKDIWKGLFEFPLIETDSLMNYDCLKRELAYEVLFKGSVIENVTLEIVNKKHVLSHRILYANFYRIELSIEGEGLSKYQKIASNDLDSFAVSRLMHIYLEKMD
jgi:A/G-specific adenine glycosylase